MGHASAKPHQMKAILEAKFDKLGLAALLPKVANKQSHKLPEKQAIRLYNKGVFLGYKRSKANQYEHTSLIKIQGVASRKDVDFYLGKRIVYLYRAKKLRNGSKVRTIWGRVTRPHGNSGVVRAKFAKNLPPKAMGSTVRVMLYPSRV